MMTESYESGAYDYVEPMFGKLSFRTLMVDGSVQPVGDSQAAFDKWMLSAYP